MPDDLNVTASGGEMTDKPLDPCPMCGLPVVEALPVPNWREQHTATCPYPHKIADYRLLCAQVALARAVIERRLLLARGWDALRVGPHDAPERAEFDDAIAAVREAEQAR
jgi:hypothetical protein